MKGGPLRQVNARHLSAHRRDHRAILVPLGADDGFEPIVDLEPLTDDDKAGLAALWDRTFASGRDRRYRGLLDAEVVDGSDDEAPR